jgi:hypothetical protein
MIWPKRGVPIKTRRCVQMATDLRFVCWAAMPTGYSGSVRSILAQGASWSNPTRRAVNGRFGLTGFWESAPLTGRSASGREAWLITSQKVTTTSGPAGGLKSGQYLFRPNWRRAAASWPDSHRSLAGSNSHPITRSFVIRNWASVSLLSAQSQADSADLHYTVAEAERDPKHPTGEASKGGERVDVLATPVGVLAPALLEALAVLGLRLWVSAAGHAGDVPGVRLHRQRVFRAVVWLLLVATAS